MENGGSFPPFIFWKKSRVLELAALSQVTVPGLVFFLLARWVPQFVRTVEASEVTKCPQIAAASSEQRDVVGHDA